MKQLYEIIWQDAAYTYEKELPKDSPGIDKTIGYLIEDNDEYVNISISLKKDENGEFYSDGFVIPKKAVISMKKYE